MKFIASELSKAIKASNAEALAGTAGKYGDMDLVHAVLNYFGLGTADPGQDLASQAAVDATVKTGVYSVNNVSSMPGTAYGHLLVLSNATQRTTQTYRPLLSSTTKFREFNRFSLDGGASWSGWDENFHTGNVETTAQNLLENGSYGWGRSDLADEGIDANTITHTGIRFLSTGQGATNMPLASGAWAINTVLANANGLEIIQKAYQQSVPANEYIRRAGTNAISDWFLRYNQANILGTVSQSGGTPTGAIIERGSNANGEYVKFADGTMEQWRQFKDDDGAGTLSWTFPVSFINVNTMYVNCTVVAGASSYITTNSGLGISAAEFKMRDSTTGALVNSAGRLYAIGRWYE